jgi:hypothetical protein
MARSLLRHVVSDGAGNVIQNALVRVYLTGTTTPVTDMYAASSGGATIATLTSNDQGEIVGWLTTPKFVDLSVTDNTDGAYYPSRPAVLMSWTDFTETVQVFAANDDVDTLSATLTASIAAEAVSRAAGDSTNAAAVTAEATARAAADTSEATARAAADTAEAAARVAADAAAALVTSTSQTADYVLALADAGTAVEMNKASAVTVTVPPNSSVAFSTGTIVEVFQLGAGQVTVAAGVGVTLRAAFGTKTAAQYTSAFLRKRAADEWIVFGDTTT